VPVWTPGPVLEAPFPCWGAAQRPWEAAEGEAAQELVEEAGGLQGQGCDEEARGASMHAAPRTSPRIHKLIPDRPARTGFELKK